MIYKDGITINGVHSNADFDLVINSRQIDLPPKNSIRKTIPFMSGFYDFTTLGGSATWGERNISYTFDIVGTTVTEMDRKRTEVVNWLCNQHDVDIYDDTIPDYHFHGSYNDSSQNEEDEKSELTVSFVCYPFMIKNEPQETVIYDGGTYNVVNSGQPLYPLITSAQKCTVKIGNRQQTVSNVTNFKMGLLFGTGENAVEISKDNIIARPFADTTKTENGITFTDNGDGTVSANGTATDTAWFNLRTYRENFNPGSGEYLIAGCPENAEGTCLRVWVYDTAGKGTSYDDTGNGVYIKIDENAKNITVSIRVGKGVTLNNAVFAPVMYGKTTLRWTEEVL